MSHEHGPANPPSRREVLAGLAAAATLVGARKLGATIPTRASAPGSSYLDAALGAERWLRRHAITGGDTVGTTWAADPSDPKSVQSNMYSGSPGVVLFYLELARATGDKAALKMAEDGALYLRQRVLAGADAWAGERAGLYTGLAGVAFTLERAHAATGNASLRDAARQAITMLVDSAKPSGDGASWSASNDIISGSAGIGLTLLWADKALGMTKGIPVAARAGRALLANGVASQGGLTWHISPAVPRRYPNFSHGAGGVAYFLAALHEVTKERAFLDGALKGAAYLQAVATDTPTGGRMVFHSEPGNEQLFYLSWCHGPSGTARLFDKLAAITGKREFGEFSRQLDVATRDMKVPEQSPGFWNNVSMCCGNCGVSEHLVSRYERTGDTRHLDYAKTIADDVIRRATADGDGLKWIQAEHRVQPTNLVAQTGLMQGASGVGLAMLHLDGALNKRRAFIVLPDDPHT
jgi:lantibiotic modifying enzyme